VRLLPTIAFAPIFAGLKGASVGYVRNEFGNAGDALQREATYQLFDRFGIEYTVVNPEGHWNGSVPAGIDQLVLFGGGNMGLRRGTYRLRRQAVAAHLPITQLPNSWVSPEPETVQHCRAVYAREAHSLKFCPEAIVAPDMALGFEYAAPVPEPVEKLGVFFRRDWEGRFADHPGNQGPPFAGLGQNVYGYLALAARYETIVTDALHFAICGLFNRRRVILLPTKYHKSRGMYEAWLDALGCEWADTPAAVRF